MPPGAFPRRGQRFSVGGIRLGRRPCPGGGQPTNVTDIYVDGRLRKTGGALVGVDEREVVRQAEQAAARLPSAA
ncbi:hypothetical protein ACF1DY_32345 [Streptomyces albus]